MKLSLSEISTVNATFEEDVIAYSNAGFDGIGVWEMKLPGDDAANVALIGQAGLGVASCVPAVPSILPLRLPGMEGPPKPRDLRQFGQLTRAQHEHEERVLSILHHAQCADL